MHATALPATRRDPARHRAYAFLAVACHNAGHPDRQRTALVDMAALVLSVGAPDTARHMLTAAGVDRLDARALLRILSNDPDEPAWAVIRRPTGGRVYVDDARRVVIVDRSLNHALALDTLTLVMPELSRLEAAALLGPAEAWTVTPSGWADR